MIHFFKRNFIDPLTEFIYDSRAIGITLLSCTAISLAVSNVGTIGEMYRNIWSFSFDGTLHEHANIGFISLPNSPLIIINDLLMSLFFFLAGMEIKREMLEGELSSVKKSLLPIIAAMGGMMIPALLFILFNHGTYFMNGWAIPSATDIAFTLGVASLLGKRVPVSLKIFLTALAIIDDLGAIIIIALFYGNHFQVLYIFLSVVIIIILFLLRKNTFGIIQWILGFLLWYCMFNSGIHATVAGVVFAFLIPKNLLKKFEMQFHLPVYFTIVPVFALANTAILFPANSLQSLTGSLSWGIIFGLCIGKPLGIVGTSFFVVKRKLAMLPQNVNWHQMIGAGLLGGIGFTMSIFISTLAFHANAEKDIAKISVLIASVIAMLSGFIWLRYKK
ncbi:MAG: Na+/H+ antiporter NhaA [Bacteroidota bacterium]|nr:Na+/H+ antiporter NhaA [Bacteroidota bacterium]